MPWSELPKAFLSSVPYKCSLSLIMTSPSSLPKGPHSFGFNLAFPSRFIPQMSLYFLTSFGDSPLSTIFFSIVEMTYFPVQRARGLIIVGANVSTFMSLFSEMSSLKPAYTSCMYYSRGMNESLEVSTTPDTTESWMRPLIGFPLVGTTYYLCVAISL